MKTAAERFWAKVSGGDVTECWTWQGSRHPAGYGQFSFGGRPVRAHRWAYEALRAEIPAGLDLDHLCRNRGCVNPWHLDPVTRAVNLRRGVRGALTTHCPQGHAYDEANTYTDPSGKRRCRICNLARFRARYRNDPAFAEAVRRRARARAAAHKLADLASA